MLMEISSLMKVKSIAECSLCVLFEWPLKTGFTVLSHPLYLPVNNFTVMSIYIIAYIRAFLISISDKTMWLACIYGWNMLV